ncbi:hypothetical protein NDU88_000891 [Pleurodeles waltl]|uniref:Uncharacterized protein n=1 Tax=Pleurodeles waltl TaxID=8319 RepID=A0AAV7VY91_PLEWA|nr:hypothetical protein NDU88_000891 [Pleurodeles waltl]
MGEQYLKSPSLLPTASVPWEVEGGTNACPLERQAAVSLVLPGTQHVVDAPAPTLHIEKLDKSLATRQDLHNRVDVVAVEVNLLREDQKILSTRVACTESELRDLEQSLKGLEWQVRSLSPKVWELEH